MVRPHSNKALAATNSGGSSPFDKIRRTDAYGREYWLGRELMPLMGYLRWEDFAGTVIDRAIRSSRNTGTYSDQAFSVFTEKATGGRGRQDYRLNRLAAYLVAMNGDPNKQQVAEAQAYFAARAREAELGALTELEIRRTALARAREMVDYRIFRDMMAENATDYVPSSRESGKFFAMMQNKLYLHLVGMTADQIKKSRTLQTWPGIDEGKSEPGPKSGPRKVAKNYLTAKELAKLDRMVSRLCLTAEEITEDGVALSLAEWNGLLDDELAMSSRRMLAA